MIKFTQFLRPNGRSRRVTIERDATTERRAHALQMCGAAFEIEELTTGRVYMDVTIPHDGEPYVLANEVCDNGPDVPEAVDRLTAAAYRQAVHMRIIPEGDDHE